MSRRSVFLNQQRRIGARIVAEEEEDLNQHPWPVQHVVTDERHLITVPWLLAFQQTGKKRAAAAGVGELKATFGLLRTLAIENDLTNHFICRTGGTFHNIAVNAKIAPTGSTARLTIEKSVNEGVSWTNILASPAYIELVIGDTSVQTYSNFVAAPLNIIAPDNLLRINCTQKGSTVPGQYIEVVVRWAPEA